MSKPMTKATLANMKDFAKGLHEEGYYDMHAKVNALIAEIERLQKLAKPNRKPKTRNTVRHINTTARTITVDERGGGYGYEIDNPDYGKVCPCKDCKESGGKRFTMQALIDKARAYDGRLG